MPSGLELGINELIIHADLVSASLRWDEHDTLNILLKGLEQFICQANGPVSVMSDCAINDGNFYHVDGS
jgi:hypothetical protein